ncbi:thiamine-phosphate kinase [Novilysobacter defluvii]|nr:thiamine-phosphate kinase [Lysobacter defluvii]
MAEFDLIDRIRRRIPARADVALGIGDDAALLQVPAGRQLVVCADTLNEGIHFPAGTAAADIGWKALAVNLSDLAAMGAEPAWCTLSLSLPAPDVAWLDAFLDGFLELAALHRVALVGGDTTRGPLSVSVTAHGFVEPGRALLRGGAGVGEDIWVSGTLGDAAAALALLEQGAPDALRQRLDRPTPRVELGRALAGIATAAVDVSDGLLADLAHVCRASGVGAEVELDRLPASAALRDAVGPEQRRAFQAAGGDDYELCFTAPVERARRIEGAAAVSGVAVARIGRTVGGSHVVMRDGGGRPWAPDKTGYEHFG